VSFKKGAVELTARRNRIAGIALYKARSEQTLVSSLAVAASGLQDLAHAPGQFGVREKGSEQKLEMFAKRTCIGEDVRHEV